MIRRWRNVDEGDNVVQKSEEPEDSFERRIQSSKVAKAKGGRRDA